MNSLKVVKTACYWHLGCCNFIAHFIDLVSVRLISYEFIGQLMKYAYCSGLHSDISLPFELLVC